MRKILALTICSFCLCVPLTVQADDNATNVTNQLDEIIVQLDNLDAVIQFFTDNKENLEWFLDSGTWDSYFLPTKTLINAIRQDVYVVRMELQRNLVPDVASIKQDVAAISADLAGYVSQIVASINGVSAEVEDLHQWLISIDFSRIQHILTQSQLDESLRNFVSELDNNSYVLGQILDSIRSLDNFGDIQNVLDDIVSALNQIGNITVYVDLVEELENMDLHFDLDLDTALSGLEGDLGSVLSVLNYFLSEFQHFYTVFVSLQNDEALTNINVREFLAWYQGAFFTGLQQWATSHREWLFRQEAIEQAEAEHRAGETDFLTGDGDFPTGYEPPYQVIELEDALEEEAEVPDEKIEAAAEGVSADMGEVEHELTDAMEEVDASFKGFLEDVKFKWGSFNSVMKFSVTLPNSSKYKFDLEYDFSQSDLLSPCRAASTGLWGIVLFVYSYLAISSTFKGLTNN